MTQFNSVGKYLPGHHDGDGCVFPDPGHFAARNPSNPPNKILVDLRRYHAQRQAMRYPKGWDHMVRQIVHYPGAWKATPEEEVHAHKVISRLERLEKIS